MAILMMFEVEGAGKAEYDATNRALGIKGDDDAPDGLITHVAGLTEDGMLTVDVWESKEKLLTFFDERLNAALEQAGIEPGQPLILPVHNVIAQGAGKKAGTMVVLDIQGITSDTYDKMAASMEAHEGEGRNHPAVQHVAALTEDGLLVVDVWESPAAFAAFAENEIGPAAAAAGMTAEMEPLFLPVVGRIHGRVAVAR